MKPQHFVLLLRVTSLSLMAAVLGVLLPHQVMDWGHQMVGLGPLGPDPMFFYLARSVSGLYAILGFMLWIMAGDIERYRPLLALLGWIATIGGCSIGLIGAAEGLPWYWWAGEGPMTTILGLVVLAGLQRREQ